jgi:acetyl-CoA C-acetyltransferase
MREVVIVGGVRTAIGAFGGALKDVPVVQLGSIVIREVLKRANLRPVPNDQMKIVSPDLFKGQRLTELERRYYKWDDNAIPVTIDEVIMGNVLPEGQGQNTARQAMIYAGLTKETPAFTVNKVCASGLKAITLGATAIMAGQADIVVAGGMENMSDVPMALPEARWGYKMEISTIGKIYDLMVFDGLYETFYGYHMGITAENIAAKYIISRDEQDEIALLSHQRAMAAIRAGKFKDEIVPVEVIGKDKQVKLFDTDERPMDTTIEKLGKLKPAFKEDGTVTAGNASGINDAAAAVLLMSAERAKELGLESYATIKGFAAGSCDPAYMGLGIVPAVRKVLRGAGMTVYDLEMIELNEAFAAQVIACMRELEIEWYRPNELGSGISLGHPIGSTGARQVVTGIHQMKREDLSTGMFTMCIGGGMGLAMLIERS